MVDKINKLHRVRWKGDTATVEGRPCSELHKDGEGVLVGIIDVQGFDFTHPDFLNPDGRTRWEAIWDQGGTTRPAPKSNRADEGDFAYGSLIRKHHMESRRAQGAAGRGPHRVVLALSAFSTATGKLAISLRIPTYMPDLVFALNESMT